MKLKSCKNCKVEFAPYRMGQKVCSPDCALSLAISARGKSLKVAQVKDKRETKQKLNAMRTLPQLKRIAQTAFNGYIRARDTGRPCISCGVPLPAAQVGGGFDCGHYRSIGSAPHMRFVEDNAHGQCKHCNRHLAGNHVAYRAGLVDRIGQRAVALIEADSTLRKYTREGLIELARYYAAEAKRFKVAAS